MDASEVVQQGAGRTGGGPSLRFSEIFPDVKKPLIAMAHVPALPGTPLYAESEGVRGLVNHVRQEVSALVDAGFDAVMFCNENDRPYVLKADLVASAVMARVVAECAPKTVPFGVDYLWDAECALAAAVATEARFMREVVTGVWESDMGLWNPDAASLLRHRRSLHADKLAIFMNVTPEFASSVGERSPCPACPMPS
jgi:membrane complex biogenesis BtpA family protein